MTSTISSLKLNSGVIAEDCVWTAIEGDEPLVDTLADADPTPAYAIAWYDSGFIASIKKLTIVTSTLTGRLRTDMVNTSGGAPTLNVAGRVDDAAMLITEEATRDLRNYSLFDLCARAFFTDGRTADIPNYSMTMVPSGYESPDDVFTFGDFATTAWWLELYANMAWPQFTAVSRDEPDRDVRTMQARQRQRVPWLVSAESVQSLAMEYRVLSMFSEMFSFEKSEEDPLQMMSNQAQLDVVRAIPVSKTLSDMVTTHLMPYNAKVGNKTVRMIPLPSCLAGDDLFIDVPNIGKSMAACHRFERRFSVLTALKPHYIAWARDFVSRITIDSSLMTLWQAFFPGAVRNDTSKGVALPAREAVLSSRLVVSSDGVYTDRTLSPHDEPYARFIDGYLRRKRILTHQQYPLDGDDTNPPALVVVPPETELTRRTTTNMEAPSVMRGTKPANKYTPYVSEVYESVKFMERTGIAAVNYPNLTVKTTRGERPPRDGDELFASGYYLAERNGFRYNKPQYDIASFYLLNSDGRAVRGSQELMRFYFLTGVFESVQPDYILDDDKRQTKVAAALESWLTSPDLRDYQVAWRTIRWLQSTGSGRLKHFAATRETVQI